MSELAKVLPAESISAPLRLDDGDVVRVGRSRVSLDLIVEQYENGMTPEELVRAYDSLALHEVHSVISYYLRHRSQVQEYLKRRAAEAALQRTQVEAARKPMSPEEIAARLAVQESLSASRGQ